MNFFNFDNTFLMIFELIMFLLVLFNYNKISEKLNLYDKPDKIRKIHNTPVSVIGGLLLFIITIATFYTFTKHTKINSSLIITSYISLFLLFFLGYLDDLNKFQLKNKILSIIIIILFVVTVNDNLIIKKIYIESLDKEIYLFKFSIIFTIMCIFLLFNAINLMDGANGILISYFIFLYYILFFDLDKYFLILNITMLCLMLIYNYNNKFFSGNSGANSISMLISLSMIIIYNEKLSIANYKTLSAETIFLILILPGVDMLRVFSERIFKNKNPLVADNIHFHHLLMKIINKKYVFIPYIIASTFPFIVSLMGISKILIIILFLLQYIILVLYLKRKSNVMVKLK